MQAIAWIKNLDELRRLKGVIDDPEFCREFRQVKVATKQDLATSKAFILIEAKQSSKAV